MCFLYKEKEDEISHTSILNKEKEEKMIYMIS